MIKLKESKHSCYILIYRLRFIEFAICKIDNKTYTANCFIIMSKLLLNAIILFIDKIYGSFYHHINPKKIHYFQVYNQYLVIFYKKNV